MNFIIRNLLLFFVLLCTVACSSDENFDQSSLENIDFRVSVVGQSRVAMQKNGSGDFQAGDEVALRMYEPQPDKLQDKTLLHCEGKQWTSSLYWEDWKGTPHFYAVWPSATQVELWEGTCWYVHRVSRNQSAEEDFWFAEEDFWFSDLLVADAAGERYSPVNLDFRHAMSRVMVNIKNMETLSDEERQQVQVYVHGYLSGRFALSGNAVQTTEETDWIQAYPMNEDGSFAALAVPGELERFRTEGWIKIVAGNRELVYNAPESIGNTLESGKQVTVNLQLKSEEVVPEEPVWWVDGIQPSDQWEYEAPVYRMPWRQNCGWFDCNKLDARDTSPTGDGRTCWEASSSNLMHWCLNANRSYVERYLEYKRRLNPEFPIPSAYPDSKHSKIYQGFKNRFGNKSGYIVSGVNWFLSGICNWVMYPQNVPEQENAVFFFEVFGRNSLVKQYGNGYMTKEEFNNAIKLAKKQGMAVGLDIFIQGGGHAINLWGAEFNEMGEVSTIYLVDNNDGNSGYMKWVYNEDLKIKIMDLVLLDKGTSYWESFFKSKNG